MTEQQIIEAMVDAYQGHNPDHMPDGYDWPHEAMQAAYAVARDAVMEEVAREIDNHSLEYFDQAQIAFRALAKIVRAMKGPSHE